MTVCGRCIGFNHRSKFQSVNKILTEAFISKIAKLSFKVSQIEEFRGGEFRILDTFHPSFFALFDLYLATI